MTTDLTGDFEVGEDELDWDVFLPDPVEADVAAEAAALDDEDELSLDDSHFDWERAIREDAESENDNETRARAGAAYDRIVDTMRPSRPEPDAAKPETEPETAPFATAEPTRIDAFESFEPAAADEDADATAPFGSLLDGDPEPEDLVAFGPASAQVQDEPPAAAFDPPADTPGSDDAGSPAPILFLAETESGTEQDQEDAFGRWWYQDDESAASGPEPEVASAFEPRHAAADDDADDTPFGEGSAAGSVGAVEADRAVKAPAEPLQEAATAAVTAETAADWDWVPAESPQEEPVTAVDTATEVDPGTLQDQDQDQDQDQTERAERPKRSRVFKATVVLACVFLVAIAAVVVVRARHTSTPPTAPTAPTAPTHAAPPAPAQSTALAAAAARIVAATQSVNSATTAANVGITSLSTFPTPTNVEAVVNPYISSLQLYETFLSGTTIPTAAKPAAADAVTQIRQDLAFLDTIDGLPAQQLGAFLEQFVTNATHLQTTLSTLEQKLGTPAS